MADRHPQRLAFLIRLVHQAIRRELDAAVRGLGLTMPQVAALSALARRSGASNADLARAAFVSAQSMGEILASLEEEALINRAVDKQNNRVLRTTLSAKGAAALKRADREIERIERRITDALGASDAAVLRALLQRCAAALQSEVAATAVSAPGST